MNLYVGNLPYKLSEAQLTDLFAQFGEVKSAKIIKDQATGQSKGFGFVEMSSNDGGQQAMQALNGKEVEGRKIIVNEARPPQKKSGPGGPRRY
ncbi:MAG: RNA recognition motif domain-containing protein [Thermodesulfobacteriota bacterium]|jgi:RNA recognition motif-containing protein